MQTSKPSFADGLVELDMRETRARLAEALAAVKSHPGYAAGTRAATLHGTVEAVQRALLMVSRECIHRLDAALVEADRPPATLAAAHADTVAGLDADAPPPPVRRSPPPAPLRGPVPPRPRLPARP